MIIHCNKLPNKKKSATRKQASSFSFALYDAVAMINESDWNKVVEGRDFFLQLAYLTALENSPPTNMHFQYALIYNAKVPVAVAYFQLLDVSFDALNGLLKDEKNDSFSGYIKKHITNHILKSVNKLKLGILICGNSFISGEHGFIYTSDINPLDAFDALADVIYKISNTGKFSEKIEVVLVKDFYKPSVENAKELEEYKYHDFLVEPNMVLMIDPKWSNFEDYLSVLSKKYRHRAKTIIKKGNVFERQNFSEQELKIHSKKIYELYSNVLLKARFRMATLPESYFVEMKKKLQDQFQVVGYFLNGQLVGFKSSFLLEKQVEAHFVGLDYSINKEYELYQNILYDYLKDAVLLGKNSLHFGRTASEIKSNIGAKAQELTCYARHQNTFSNKIIKHLIDQLKPEEWTPRNPFK